MVPMTTLLWLTGMAWAGDVDRLRDIRAAQRDGAPATEVALCRAAVHEEPASRSARVCRGRLEVLEPRADTDNGFAGLARLERVQRTTGSADDTTIAEVVSLVSAPTTSDALRHDAQIWLARVHLVERDDPEAALVYSTPLWEAWQAHALLDDQAAVAADVHARALARSGDVTAAQAVEAARRPERSVRPQEGVPAELRRRDSGRLLWVSRVAVGAFAVGFTPLAAMAWRRRGLGRPMGVLPLSMAALGSLLYAALWNEHTLALMGSLWAWVVLAHIVVAQASGLTQKTGPRLLLGVAGAVGTLAGVVLLLHHHGELGRLI